MTRSEMMRLYTYEWLKIVGLPIVLPIVTAKQ